MNVISNPKLRQAAVISFSTHGLANGEIDEYSLPGLALTPKNSKDNISNGFQ